MTRRCDLTGTLAQVGHLVSHANNKTLRRFLPNLQETSLLSESTGRQFRLRVTVATLRTVEKQGGLDAFLANADARKLSPRAKRAKRIIAKTAQTKAAASAARG